MARVAAELLDAPVEHELSVVNVDKPPLDAEQIRRRAVQFHPAEALWLTRAATFVEKAELFPGATFVVGVDTLERLVDPRYYQRDPARRDAALRALVDLGCRFLVFGRRRAEGFFTLDQLALPETLQTVCRPVPESKFRRDISSTQLRGQTPPGATPG